MPEDIEYRESFSNFSALCLALKKDIPSFFTKVVDACISGLINFSIAILVCLMIFGPFVPIALTALFFLFLVIEFSIKLSKHYIAKGHAFKQGDPIPTMDKSFERDDEAVISAGLLIGTVNALLWCVGIFS